MSVLAPGLRSIGIDDGPLVRGRRADVLVVGAIYRGGTWFDGLLTTRVRQDGWNATERLIAMLGDNKFSPQLRYAILDGIALGGFNVIDLDRLHAATGLKILVPMRRPPDRAAMRRALEHLPRPAARWRLIERAGAIVPIGRLHCQLRGMQPAEAEQLLALTCTRSHLPEPLRAAHLIAGGLTTGISGRRA